MIRFTAVCLAKKSPVRAKWFAFYAKNLKNAAGASARQKTSAVAKQWQLTQKTARRKKLNPSQVTWLEFADKMLPTIVGRKYPAKVRIVAKMWRNRAPSV
jgi:hypothetical protein